MQTLSLHLAADTVVDHLAGYLARASAKQIECSVAPYDQVTQAMLGEPQASRLLLWTSPDRQVPSFARLLSFEPIDADAIGREVDAFATNVRHAAARHADVFLFTWTLPPERRLPLALSGKPGSGAADRLARMNVQLGDALADLPNVHLLDFGSLLVQYGKLVHDARLYATARMRYALDFIKYVAERITPVLTATVVPGRKVVICDLDNTLWGGIVGDDGVSNVRIGGNDPLGEAHLQLQIELKALNNRGVLLAISSKNDARTAEEAIRRHPNMLLRLEDFAARRINWDDKAANISSLLAELSLLPSAAVFLDDNPTERQRVRDALPEVLVPDLPQDVAYWAGILNALGCFEALSLSREDFGRAASYRSEGQRRESISLHVSIEDWLASLDLVVHARPLGRTELSRSVQLLNKTNQFNLHTRRMGESEFFNWCSVPGRMCFTYSVQDRYGDSGLTALVSVERTDHAWRVVDFVMSCRVMGKGIEDAIVVHMLGAIGKTEPLEFAPTPTAKNAPAQEFARRIAPEGLVPSAFHAPGHVRLVTA